MFTLDTLSAVHELLGWVMDWKITAYIVIVDMLEGFACPGVHNRSSWTLLDPSTFS